LTLPVKQNRLNEILAERPDHELTVAAYPGLTITGSVGARYRIEYRDALPANGAWHVLTNVVLPSSPWLYFDREAFAHPRRFYRAVVE